MKKVFDNSADVSGVCYNCLNGGHSICDSENCTCKKKKHKEWWWVSGLQRSIAKWADEAFGPVKNPLSTISRANKEMSELLMISHTSINKEEMVEECADVVICLYRFVDLIGGNLDNAIENKMEKNKKRKWNKDGYGHGQHK